MLRWPGAILSLDCSHRRGVTSFGHGDSGAKAEPKTTPSRKGVEWKEQAWAKAKLGDWVEYTDGGPEKGLRTRHTWVTRKGNDYTVSCQITHNGKEAHSYNSSASVGALNVRHSKTSRSTNKAE